MTEHPEELLAGYVDGTLDRHERARVEAHLVACDRCEDELHLATRARQALRELPEEPVPVGVIGPVLAEASGEKAAEAERPAEPLRLRAGYWPQWFPKALAAAAGFVALVLAAGILLPRLGQEAGRGAGEAPAAIEAGKEDALAGAPQTVSTISLETQATDYDGQALSTLARETGEAYLVYSERAGAGDGSGRQPLECVARGAALGPTDLPVRVIAATFQGTPAYLGVYVHSQSPGAPPTKVVIWVVAQDECATLSYGEGRISPGE